MAFLYVFLKHGPDNKSVKCLDSFYCSVVREKCPVGRLGGGGVDPRQCFLPTKLLL